MKQKYNKTIFITIVLILIVFIFIVYFASVKIDYDSGRDTVESYGNGEYQLLKYVNKEFTKYICLMNCKYNSSLIDDIKAYKKINNQVYLKGFHRNSQVYAIIDIKQNIIKYYSTSNIDILYDNQMIQNGELNVINVFTEFSQEEQKNLNSLTFLSPQQGDKIR